MNVILDILLYMWFQWEMNTSRVIQVESGKDDVYVDPTLPSELYIGDF